MDKTCGGQACPRGHAGGAGPKGDLARMRDGLYAAHARAVAGQCERPFSMSCAAGEGQVSTLSAYGGLSVHRHVLRLRRPLTLSGCEGEGTLRFNFCLGAGVEWTSDGGFPRGRAMGEGCFCVQAGSGCETVEYRAGTPYEFVGIALSPAEGDRLKEAVGADAARTLDAAAAACLSEAIPPRTHLLLQQLVDGSLPGPAAGIHAHGKAYEVVAALLAEAIAGSLASPGLTRTDQAAIVQAREILDANLASPPTYPELAHAVFLSETKLSQGFRRLYGTSIHAYVIDWRLDLALSLIEEGADNVAQVAAKVGYGNSSHFSAAFKRRFGVLPRAVVARTRRCG